MHYIQPPIPPTSSYVAIIAPSEALRGPSRYIAQTNGNSSCNDGQFSSDVYSSDIYGGDPTNDCNSSKAELINTGTVVAFIVTIATLLILAALIVRFWKRPTNEKPGNQDNK